MPAGGGQPTQVTRNGATLSWESPDGQFLYFTKSRDWGPLSRIPIDGGEEIEVLPEVNIDHVSVFEKGICYVSRSPRQPIKCLDFATGQEEVVAELPNQELGVGLSVSPDGRWILYSRRAKPSNIMLVRDFR